MDMSRRWLKFFESVMALVDWFTEIGREGKRWLVLTCLIIIANGSNGYGRSPQKPLDSNVICD